MKEIKSKKKHATRVSCKCSCCCKTPDAQNDDGEFAAKDSITSHQCTCVCSNEKDGCAKSTVSEGCR